VRVVSAESDALGESLADGSLRPTGRRGRASWVASPPGSSLRTTLPAMSAHERRLPEAVAPVLTCDLR